MSADRPDIGDPRAGQRPDLDEAVEAWTAMGDASLLRGVAAVILGFAVLTLGSVLVGRWVISATGVEAGGPITTTFIRVSLGSRLLLAVGAGYLTGWAAPKAPRLHAGVLAGVLAFFSLAAIGGLNSSGEVADPTWYPMTMLFVGPIGVVMGGALRGAVRSRSRHRKSRELRASPEAD